MSKKRVTLSEITLLIEEANGMGADIRMPKPDERPLFLIEYNISEPSKSTTHRFYSLREARDWLIKVCGKLRAQQKKKN